MDIYKPRTFNNRFEICIKKTPNKRMPGGFFLKKKFKTNITSYEYNIMIFFFFLYIYYTRGSET